MLKFDKKQRGENSYKPLCLIILMLCMVWVTPSLVSAIVWDPFLYYNFNNTGDLVSGIYNLTTFEGTVFYNTTNGKIGNGTLLSNNNNLQIYADAMNGTTFNLTRNTSYCSWINPSVLTTADVIMDYGENGLNRMILSTDEVGDGTGIKISAPAGSITKNSGVFAVDEYNFICVVFNSTSVTLYSNATQIDSTTTTFNFGASSITNLTLGDNFAGTSHFTGRMDELSFWNRTLNITDVEELYNSGNGLHFEVPGAGTTFSIALNTPKDGLAVTKTEGNFSANFSTLGQEYVWKNATYTIWYSNNSLFNETLTTVGISNFTSFNISGFDLGTYHWNTYACAENTTGTRCDWASSNFTFPVGATILAEGYTKFTYETIGELFNINLSLVSGATLYGSGLYYNGTRYDGTITNLGANSYRLDAGVDVPLVSVGKSSNYSFFWELTYERTDGTFAYQNLTERSQIANRTWLIYCNTTFNRPYLNFSTYSAENPFPFINASFKSAWSWGLNPTGTVKRNASFEDITEQNRSWDFCAFPEYEDFTVSSTIEYDGGLYAKNFYFLDNATITNATTNVSLYLLNDTQATLTVLRTVDQAQQPVANVFIQIQAYDVGTDTFYTVANAKTSSQGEDLVYLNWYDTLYKFILIKDGVVVLSTTPYKISGTPQTFEISEGTTFDFEKFDDFLYSLTFNDVTQNFVLTYTKPSGLVDSACLRVIKREVNKDTQVCLTCETSASATLFCNINGYGNGTYIATFYATGSMKFIDTITQMVGLINEVYEEIGNLDGTAIALIVAGLVMVMFLISPVLGVVGMILGMIAAVVLGLQPADYGTMTGIALVGGIVIWLLKR